MDNCPCCFQPLPPSMDLTVSLDENCVIWKGICCNLCPTETEIMHVLAKSGPRWVHVDQIMLSVYGAGEPPSESCLRVHVTHIRRKLRDKQIPVLIECQGPRGGGTHKYRLRYG